jgi:hypothetical protein
MLFRWNKNKSKQPSASASKFRPPIEAMERRVMFTTVAVTGVIYDSPVPAVEASLNTTVTSQPKSALVVTPSKLGGNLNMQSDRVQDHPFTDLVKTTRGFYSLSGRLASNGKMALAYTDANGWPTEAFAVSLADNSEYGVPIDKGIYRMSFTGPSTVTVAARRSAPAGAATVPSTAPLPTLKKISYNATTGVHTYDITVPAGVLTLALDFRGTGGNVKNLKVLQPGYSLSIYPTFSNEYVNLLKNLGPNVVRFMDWTHTNDNVVANWSSRAKTTDATQAKVGVAGDLVSAKGIAWEYVIQLANTLNKDVWVNIPAHATDDYVKQLAALFKRKLNSNLNIYIEYSNEVWNSIFEQTKYNIDQAKAEVAANPSSSLKYDGTTDSNKWAERRYARRVKQLTDLFKSVWTTTFNGTTAQGNPINTRVRAVLSGQYSNQARFDNYLNYLNRFYGSPKNYLYGIGVAPYINLGGQQNTAGLTKDQVLNALRNSVSGLKNGTGLSNAKTRANNWGLRLIAYEGGIDTFGDQSIAAKRAAVLDPQIQKIMQDYLHTWYSKGGSQINWYTLGARSFNSKNGTWSITEDIRNYNQPKEVAFRFVRDEGLGG